MTARIPPQISLRALREVLGLTLDEVAAAVREQGVPITKQGLGNVETGERRASPILIDAIAQALNVKRMHIRQDREIRDLVAAWAVTDRAPGNVRTLVDAEAA